MEHRTFNSLMPVVNEKWASRVLGIHHNSGKGPDLVDPGKFVEVKFCLIKPKQEGQYDYPCAWTVQDHQVEYNDIWMGQGFWAFGLYELDRPIKKIATPDPEKLEKMVLNRELYITPWSWIYQFPAHTVQGKTKLSEWVNHFRYPKLKDLPKIKATYQVEKGLVHLTKGVPQYMFRKIQTNP